MFSKSSLWALIAFATLAFSASATLGAGGAAVREVGNFAVHYNAIAASELDADLATRHELPRSSDRCVVTVAIVNRETGMTVDAAVMGSVTRPDGRMHRLEMREVRDDGDVYYISALPLESAATRLEFQLEVRPGSSLAPQTIRFSRAFPRR